MDDLISRQAAIDAIYYGCYLTPEARKELVTAIGELPSAESEIAEEVKKDAADVMESVVRIARALAEVLESERREDDPNT